MASISTKFRFLIMTAMQAPRIVRHASTSTKQLTGNISFLTSPKNKLFDREKRPIVLLYCWLLAKNKNIRHYTDLYEERGFDILQVKVSPHEVLWPKSVTKTVTEIGNFLSSEPGRPLLVHGFSVGGYVHIEVLRHLLNSNEKSECQEILKRLKGQIFDSVVDVIGVAEGVSEALFPDRPILRKIACTSIKNYLRVMENSVTAVHRRGSKIFHDNSLKIPSLMLYSKYDKIGSPGPIESAIKGWKAKDVFVMSKCWTDSPHVGHFRIHRDEYVSTLDSFLGNIGLSYVPIHDKDITFENVVKNAPVSQVDEKAIDHPTVKSEYVSTKQKIFASHKSGI